jgi:hypothetical protein
MSTFPGPSNPIAYAQFQLSGGLKTNGIVTAAFAVTMAGLVYITALDRGVVSTRLVHDWAQGLLVIQSLVLLIFGAFRVESAVRADVTSRMIDSHRLMPTSAIGAILGYVFVAPATAIALAAATSVVGIGCCMYGGGDVGRYLAGSAMAFCAAVFVWSMVARFAFDSRGGFLLVLLVTGILAVSEGELVAIFPALAVLTCPLIGRSVFDQRVFGPAPMWEFAIALAGQAGIAVTCIAAAARRYRSDDAIGFTTLLGLVLLAIWVGLSIEGMSPGLHFLEGRMFRRMGRRQLSAQEFTASFSVAMLMAVMPVAAAAKSAARWVRRGPTPAMPKRPLPVFAATASAIGVAGAVLGVPWIRHSDLNLTSSEVPHRIEVCLCTLALFLTGMACLYLWTYRTSNRAILATVLWLAGTWTIPPIIAAFGNAAGTDRDYTWVNGISPVGMIAIAWDGSNKLIPGLIGQAIVTAIPITLLIMRGAKSRPAAPGFEVIVPG